jgi:hypothetical protein
VDGFARKENGGAWQCPRGGLEGGPAPTGATRGRQRPDCDGCGRHRADAWRGRIGEVAGGPAQVFVLGQPGKRRCGLVAGPGGRRKEHD